MIDHHVTNLELSKRLKELGVPQESLFAWEKNHQGRWSVILDTELFLDLERQPDLPQDLFCSAFLASELGEMLPGVLQEEGHPSLQTHIASWNIDKNTIRWAVCYHSDENLGDSHWNEGDTEPDARAKLLIHLIESGIIDPKTLKKNPL